MKVIKNALKSTDPCPQARKGQSPNVHSIAFWAAQSIDLYLLRSFTKLTDR
jgi:hypothetical protein